MKSVFEAPFDWEIVLGSQFDEGSNATSFWFCFDGDHLVLEQANSPGLPESKGAEPPGFSEAGLFIGRLHGKPCYASTRKKDYDLGPDLALRDLRRFAIDCGDEPCFLMAGRALQILRWRQTHRYCCACGQSTAADRTEFAMVCPACGYRQYPRISPCIIVLVYRERRVLLGRGRSFSRPIYSTLAGFMEPGETAEQAVRREVWEETGVIVKNVRYVGSQPWPFPHSLMLGFFAEYDNGDILIDEAELVDAAWFSVDQLPPIPPPGSISRYLIDSFVNAAPTGDIVCE